MVVGSAIGVFGGAPGIAPPGLMLEDGLHVEELMMEALSNAAGDERSEELRTNIYCRPKRALWREAAIPVSPRHRNTSHDLQALAV
jgi:hypothetical protein